MPLFLVSRKGETDYDEYDAFVVRARNAREARKVRVKTPRVLTTEEHLGADCIVRKIRPEGRSKVILGSFNAG